MNSRSLGTTVLAILLSAFAVLAQSSLYMIPLNLKASRCGAHRRIDRSVHWRFASLGQCKRCFADPHWIQKRRRLRILQCPRCWRPN